MKILVRLLVVITISLVLALPAIAGEVNLSVAASLKEVMNELSDGYAKDHPGTTFVKNYGASGALAKQIESGAPADLFISASAEWMEYLKGKNLVAPATIGTFAYNTLVFAGAPGKAASLADLAKLEKIAIGSPKSVPAGAYATEALTKAGLAAALEPKLVMAKDVRECLMYAERGEVDGAFVYKTDAILAKSVSILFTVPQELYSRVTYPLALTASAAKNADAAAFIAYLQGAAGKAVLEKYGFATK
jgi:molybdate transport system substrate-binding protein